MRKKKLVIIFCISSLICSGILTGCGGKKTTDQKNAVEEKKEVLKAIGTEAEGESVYKVVLENNTGKDIIGIAVKDSSMEEYPENMLDENDKFLKNERRNLFYDITMAKAAAENQQSDSGQPVLDPQYDIQLTFDDQAVLVLSAFPFDEIREGKICLEDEVAFIEYESAADGQKVSTKEAELNLKAEKEAAAQAEAEAAAQAEAEARAKAEAEAEARAKAEAEARAKAEAEAAERARREEQQRQQQQQSAPESSNSDNSQGCVGNDADFW